MLKIFILENQTILVESLIKIIEHSVTRIFDIFIYHSSVEMEKQINKSKPNLVILDIKFFRMDTGIPENNFYLIEKLRMKKIPVLVFLGNPDLNYLIKCKKLDVNGIVLKQAPAYHIKNGVESIISGKKYYCEVSKSLFEKDILEKERIGELELTKRQIEIYLLKIKGFSDLQISKMLNIEICSIRKHRKNARDKNACNNDEIIQRINFWLL